MGGSGSVTGGSLAVGAEVGDYEIRGFLGRGGMGEVYLASDRRLSRQVALKILPAELNPSPEKLGRFRREAAMAASLTHPNICTIHEIGEVGGRSYIAMEYIEGQTLQTAGRCTSGAAGDPRY
jgi:serine/threonine protein kinase